MALPDFAEFIIGRRYAPTRWLHPGYRIMLIPSPRHDDDVGIPQGTQ
jgi:hypothetical protein